jgi:transposase
MKADKSFNIKRNMAVLLCYEVGKMDIADIAKIFNISRSLIYKIINKK